MDEVSRRTASWSLMWTREDVGITGIIGDAGALAEQVPPTHRSGPGRRRRLKAASKAFPGVWRIAAARSIWSRSAG